MALNSTQDTNTRPTPTLLSLPLEIRHPIYEHFFAPDLSTAQYSDKYFDCGFGQGMGVALRLGLLAVCKQIHAEAIDVLYKCSVFHFRTFVIGATGVSYVKTHTSEDGVYRMTVEEPHRANNTFVPITVYYPPLFCYRPRPHIHMIRNIHLLHSMEGQVYSLSELEEPPPEERFCGLDMAIALYLTILKDTSPHLETLTIEFAYDVDVRSCHWHRFPRTVTYLRESKVIHDDTISLLEQLLPQLRQVRIVTVGRNRHDYTDGFGFIDSLQKMLSDRGAVHEVVEPKEWNLSVPSVDIRTLNPQETQDFPQAQGDPILTFYDD